VNSALVGSLIGVVLGSLGAIGAQWVGARSASKVADSARAEQKLALQRQLIREFLQEAQEAEERAIYRYQNGHAQQGATSRNLWFLQKYLSLIIPELSGTAEAYAWRLDRLLWNDLDEGYADVWHAMSGPRTRFLDAAGKVVHVNMGQVPDDAIAS
jgi:hypothetical protein